MDIKKGATDPQSAGTENRVRRSKGGVVANDTVTTEGAHRYGRVVFLGPPNAGKSTLLNRLLGYKLAATCSKPQTTRRALLGVRSESGWQMLCQDTPGLQTRYDGELNRRLRREAENAAVGADLALLLCSGLRRRAEEELMLELIRRHRLPAILVLNKIDRIRDKRALLPRLQKLAAQHDFLECVPLSAHTGENLERLEQCLARHLPQSPPCFPSDFLSPHDGQFFAEEFLREQLSRRLRGELPYRLAVTVGQRVEDAHLLDLELLVWVERKGQKRITIGRGGLVLKESASQARLQLQRLLGKRVMLRVWVKVVPCWSRQDAELSHLGLANS